MPVYQFGSAHNFKKLLKHLADLDVIIHYMSRLDSSVVLTFFLILLSEQAMLWVGFTRCGDKKVIPYSTKSKLVEVNLVWVVPV